MSQCEVENCNDSAGKRVRTRGVEMWLCTLHAGALDDALHVSAHTHQPPRVTTKRNRFDDERRTDMRARGNP